MPTSNGVDMSAAWLAHAPPPPPTADSRKPRRSSSYDPIPNPKGTSHELHTRGGYLPPSSHAPEPERSRHNSVSAVVDRATTSTPSSPIRRARSKVNSSPAPPAPSAFYNYQHQLQQQQQQAQQQYHQSQQPQQYVQQQPQVQHTQQYAFPSQHDPAAYPTSAAMTHTRSESASAQGYADYSRERRGSAPAVPLANALSQPPQQAAASYHYQNAYQQTPPQTISYASTSMTYQPMSQAVPPANSGATFAVPMSPPNAESQHPVYATAPPPNVAPNGYAVAASQEQQQWPAYLPSQTLPTQSFSQGGYAPVPNVQSASAPLPQQPFDPQAYYSTPPQQHSATFGGPSPQLPNPVQSGTAPASQPFPVMGPPPVPSSHAAVSTAPLAHPAYITDLSRQSTTSSVGSVRRPLPQPNRTSSSPSAPGWPVVGRNGLASRGSVRRDLPRPPSGAAATISSGSRSEAGLPGSPGSPSTGSARLPASALNRTESVRMAAEALMARGVPQRRPLRSALGNSTFSPPSQTNRLPNVQTSQRSLPSSRSESVTDTPPVLEPSVPQSAYAAMSTVSSPSQTSSVVGHPPTIQVDTAVQAVSPASAPARYQDAMQQASNAQPNPRPLSRSQPATFAAASEASDLADSLGKVSISHQDATSRSTAQASARNSVLTFRFSAEEEEPEKPRRRRGSSVSRKSVVAVPSSHQPSASSAVPTINFPSGNDHGNGDREGPSIQISGADDDEDEPPSGPVISVSADDDDTRSQTSNGSKGPSICVSFSGEPSAKSQRAGTSQAPAVTPYSRAGTDNGLASSSSVGNGAVCFSCRKWIAGKVVHALDTTFHPGCFVCAHCSEGLEHVAFYEHEGLPYCHFDYHELFSKRCFHCRTPIVDERFITVQDEELTGQDGDTKERCYHELHFFCANCGDPFLDPKVAGSAAGSDPGLMTADENGKIRHGGMEFIVHKGYPYCEKCHINLHKPRCKGCKKPIIYDLISALGGKYHPECFKCSSCAQPFSETQFFVKDGKPYDEECYKVLLRNLI